MKQGIISILVLTSFAGWLPAQTNEQAKLKFNFSRNPATESTAVTSGMVYSKERRFGFEPGAVLTANELGIRSDKPFFLHAALPEGNYRVTVTFGDSRAASDTTVLAELRRLMIEHVVTEAGVTATKTFIVNIRQPAIRANPSAPEIQPGEVKIGGREKSSEIWAWDDRLSLEFNGPHPAVSAIEIEKVEVPTIYLLGDSTVCDQPVEPYNSWGQMLTRFLKPQVAVCNGAESGDSIAPALGARRFDKFWSQMKQGDYLFIQFGHNDMKSNAPGALETYTNNMRKAVDETRKHGGTPVLITSVSRRTFGADGKIQNSFGGYTDAVRKVAEEKKVALIDLQNMGAAFYESLGPQGSHAAFATAAENTHHNNYGSYEIAKCVVMGIKQNHLDLANFIVDDFKDFDPAHPDEPATMQISTGVKAPTAAPAGN